LASQVLACATARWTAGPLARIISAVSAWTYYSPLLFGALLVVALNDALRATLPPLEPWQTWLIVAGVALAAAIQSQVLMIGTQGAFAQVLPVPLGRSIRGGAAATGGWLLIAWVALSSVAALLGFERVTRAAVVVGVLGVAALVGALVTYIWNIPAAQRDFAADA